MVTTAQGFHSKILENDNAKHREGGVKAVIRPEWEWVNARLSADRRRAGKRQAGEEATTHQPPSTSESLGLAPHRHGNYSGPKLSAAIIGDIMT